MAAALAPDLVRDFAYAKITTAVPAGAPGDTLVIAVDSTTRLPSNSDLSAYSFWMTIESDLPTGAFEILRVLSTSATAVTCLRGQDGSSAVAHPAGVYLKGSITAAMYRRATTYRRYQDLGNVTSAGRAVVSTTSGQPNVLRTLVASSHGVAVVTSKLTATLVLTGTSAGRAVVTATTVSPNVTKPLAGTAAGRATSTASITVKGAFSGTAAGAATVRGTLTVPTTSAKAPAIAIRPIGVGAI